MSDPTGVIFDRFALNDVTNGKEVHLSIETAQKPNIEFAIAQAVRTRCPVLDRSISTVSLSGLMGPMGMEAGVVL